MLSPEDRSKQFHHTGNFVKALDGIYGYNYHPGDRLEDVHIGRILTKIGSQRRVPVAKKDGTKETKQVRS